ncbi:MAG: polyribonucleotide nucleotidyltransferase [Candidatus Yonathbacteria bacterium]|nr:polyribonucleotide nucleotidyltransferase [Candidatus Yonathbacteria bacterium]NTW47609.1 polyribonucleotide nucleotidyltransferase [Candidatus Yonathbacteria bacterium]
MHTRTFETEIGGKKLIAEFSDLAEQTDGSVILRYGDTVVLATAVMSSNVRDGDFFPLTVDYEERFYAAGEILGSRFMRREGKPSDNAILSGRIVDRTIRPLFDQRIRNEVQVVITTLSLGDIDPDILAVNAASLALATSRIPWHGPVSAVRLVQKNVESDTLVNPSYTDRTGALLELTVCGKNGNINMIEAGGAEAHEDIVTSSLARATKEIEHLQAFQTDIIATIGKEKAVLSLASLSEAGKTLFAERIAPKLSLAVFTGKAGKDGIYTLKDEWTAVVAEHLPDEPRTLADAYYEDATDKELHRGALEDNKRPDNRAFDEVRPLFAQAGGFAPSIHGTGIFYRGGTHVLSALTLGGPKDAQLVDTMEEQEGSKRFMHHYNFPPYSSGETGRMGGTNRRMIGHGALAEKALSYVIPDTDTFPYTIRIVSESLASNGSTSMASVCGSTLALMDAGVPIKRPVAGIAIGLMSDPSDMSRYKVLTDIQGPEDHHGDMDFKVAGTTEGVTAIQMDVKVDGIPVAILTEALARAKDARLHILKVITDAIPAPRATLPASAPSIIRMRVLEDQIGQVIGPSGKTIKKIRLDSGVEEIDIEDDGTIFITGKNGTAEKAQQIIHDMTREYLPGERFEGTVIKLFEFGALVKINAFTEGLVHVSELAPFRIANVADVVKEGDMIPVVVKESDDPNKLRLSLKQADPDYATRKGVQPSGPSQGHDHASGNGPRYGGLSPEEHRRRFGGR